MPRLVLEEALETTKIHPVAVKIDDHTGPLTKKAIQVFIIQSPEERDPVIRAMELQGFSTRAHDRIPKMTG